MTASVNAKAKTAYVAPTSQIYAWAVGGIAGNAMVCTLGQAMAIFTIGFGLSPVLISWALTLPRVLDAVTDPLIGHWSDNARTRWGRRKPFMFGSAVIGAVMLSAIWWASRAWGPWTQFVYLGIVGTFVYFCYGIYTMAWTALGYELADDYHERSRVAAIGMLTLALVLMANSWIYWLAQRPYFGNEVNGIRFISVIIAIVIIATAGIALYVCKERFIHANRRKTEPLFIALRETMRSRPFVGLLLIKLFQLLGERVCGGLLVYLAIYYVCHGNKDLATRITGYGGIIGTISSILLVPFIKPLSQRLGKKSALVAGAAVAFGSAALQPLILSPTHPYLMLLPILFVVPLTALSNTMVNAIMPDICDADELTYGERREGLFTSVMAFVSKLEISLTMLCVRYLVAWSGFRAELLEQPTSVISRLYFVAIVPNLAFTFLAVVAAVRFPMAEADVQNIRRRLDSRRQSGVVNPDDAAGN